MIKLHCPLCGSARLELAVAKAFLDTDEPATLTEYICLGCTHSFWVEAAVKELDMLRRDAPASSFVESVDKAGQIELLNNNGPRSYVWVPAATGFVSAERLRELAEELEHRTRVYNREQSNEPKPG